MKKEFTYEEKRRNRATLLEGEESDVYSKETKADQKGFSERYC